MKKIAYSFLFTFLLIIVAYPPSPTSAYTDTSVHRIETGGFVGEENVKAALEKLQAGTSWWATYQFRGDYVQDYQVYSGGFYGEENVKEKLNQFQSSTGLPASYNPKGTQEAYRKIVTGGFSGEANVQSIIENFNKSTGFTATYEPKGEGTFKKKIVSGGFSGEDKVKQVLQQFKEVTGIDGTYEPNGQNQDYYHIISGGFYGEDKVKTIVQDFAASTGIKASYEPILFTNTYNILTGGFVGEQNVQDIVNQINNDLGMKASYEATAKAGVFKIRFDSLFGNSLTNAKSYLDKNKWWYSVSLSSTKIPTVFRVVSEESLDKAMLDNGLNFFTSHNWGASVKPSGKKGSTTFRVVSNPIGDDTTLKKGLNFFSERKWWAASQNSSEKGYQYFSIISEPLLGDHLDQAEGFFKQNGWWFMTPATSKMGYTSFQIVSKPLHGKEVDDALTFFNSNGWWAASQPTSTKEKVYKIVTGNFQGYDNALANVKLISDRFGWWSTTVKVKDGPLVMSTYSDLTLKDMLDLEMKLSPQTDKYRNDPAYVYSLYVDPKSNQITENGVNVRKGPGQDFDSVAKLNKNFNQFRILGTEGEWTKISLTWKNATAEDVSNYLDPSKISQDSIDYYQFLKLSQPAGINIDEVNEKILNNSAGVLAGTASSFAKAAQLYNLNELYLISHALHETGKGTSSLATGVQYNNTTVFNMYGYGAYDSCPVTCGAQKAFEQNWTSVEDAIIGGAKLISNGYIYNDEFQQDTLYKMRWNPVNPYHQYATDIGWASKQVTSIYNLYQLLDNYSIYYDIPVYK